jgi:hypothetical protein
VVEKLIGGINRRKLDDFWDQFDDRLLMEYPQSGERIVGKENLRKVYSAFSNLPSIQVRRLRACGDLVVVEANADYGGGQVYQGVFIYELRDGRVVRETAYWAEPFQAPEWRSAWVEHTRAQTGT